MTARARRVVLRLVLAVVTGSLAACGGAADGGLLPAPTSRVDVDTAELRQLKREAGVEPCRPGDAAPVDGGLPELELACLGGGEPVDLAALRGPLVVQLWASWCAPCQRELPIFQAFHEQYGDRVRVLGLNTQDQMLSKALALLGETGAKYPQVADPGAELTAVDGLPVRGLPGVALVDAQGRVVYRALREIRSEEELVELVETELGITL